MKNITFVIEKLSTGGAERVTSILANYFSDLKDYRVRLILFNYDIGYDINSKIEVKVVGTEVDSSVLANIRQAVLVKNEIMKIEDFQTVISLSCPATNFYLGLVFMFENRKNIKLIFSERNAPMFYPSTRLGRFFRDISYKFADVVVFQTNGAKNYFTKKIAKKGIIIPNPIREDLPDVYLGERKKTIVNFCRLHKQKNLALLIEAFSDFVKDNEEFELVIYGEGSEKENLLKQISGLELDNSVHIYDFKIDIHNIVKDCYMFVSSSDYEGISNSMIEAMALGLPVICTNCPAGGASDMITSNESGILVEVGNKKQLVAAMNQLVDDDELRNKISLNASKIRTRLHPNVICKMWEKII